MNPTRWANYDPDDATLYDRQGSQIPDQPTFGHPVILPEELAAIAAGNNRKLTFLEFAEQHYRAVSDTHRASLYGVVSRNCWGTVGNVRTAWADLLEAVDRWHDWDHEADSKGHHDHPAIPSREQVNEEVDWALNRIMRFAKPAGTGGWGAA